MQDSTDVFISPFEPTVIGAMWRYRWLVLVTLVVFTVLAVVYARSQPTRYEAVASFVVEDPRASSLFDIGNVARPERYVSDQVAILASTVVAERAAERSTLSIDDVLAGTSVFSDSGSNQIQVVFEAGSPGPAVDGANAVAEAYQLIRGEGAAVIFTSAISQLDESIAGVSEELTTIAGEITTQLAAEPARLDLDRQFTEALIRLVDLQAALVDAETVPIADPESAAAASSALRQDLDDVLQQIQTLSVIVGLERRSPELTTLLEQQRLAIGRQSDLIERRDGLNVDAELESVGIVLFAPALAAGEAGSSLSRTLAVALMLGLLVSAGVSYMLALRRRSFSGRSQPEMILRAPLLGEVPDFGEEGIKSDLPVLDHPASAAADAFRFVAAAVDVQLAEGRVDDLEGEQTPMPGLVRSFVMVSGHLGDGKTVVAANMALASARQGNRVLVIDADFGHQRLSAPSTSMPIRSPHPSSLLRHV